MGKPNSCVEAMKRQSNDSDFQSSLNQEVQKQLV